MKFEYEMGEGCGAIWVIKTGVMGFWEGQWRDGRVWGCGINK